jgi:hypothetical protein
MASTTVVLIGLSCAHHVLRRPGGSVEVLRNVPRVAALELETGFGRSPE